MGISLEGPSLVDFDPEAAMKNDFLHQIGHEDHFSSLGDKMHQKFRIENRIYPVFAFTAPLLAATPIFQYLSTHQAKNDTTINSIIYRACICCADLAYRPFTVDCVYISKNFGICLVMLFKVPRLLAMIVVTISNPVTSPPPPPKKNLI